MAVRLIWRPEEAASIGEATAIALQRGGIAVIPTESGQEAIAWGLAPDAAARLSAIAGDHPLALALRSHGDLLDWLPHARGRITNLARKHWPGPLGMFASGGEWGLASKLPDSVRRAVWTDHGLALRMPAMPLIDVVQAVLGGPLLIASIEGTPEADVLIEAEPSVLAPAAVTWVQANPSEWRIVRPGVVPAEHLAEDSACSILFLCTGNTCRSPMAAGLCRMLLAQALGCAESELASRGFRVQSAGLSAMMGQSASSHADKVTRAWGADLSEHRSQRLTGPLYYLSDHVFAMTRSHLEVLESIPPQPSSPRPRLLSPYNEDIADPYGGHEADYRACAEQILEALKLRLPEILES
ncbi:MAG: Sua5/YciO/YrdC/YwlC family protein [Gemmataceae bacterium]|nr:Sua5/YciO/YrdC/YwlC family protein [Gemmataceae bacterium]